MITLQVLEHEKVPIVVGRRVGEAALTKKEAGLLERLMPKLPRGVCRLEHEAVRFSHHCGVICLGSTVLEVLPKITGKEHDTKACRDALIDLLNECKELKPARSGRAPIRMQQPVLLDAFVLEFCSDIETQVAQGLLHRYVARIDHIPVVRGKLRLDLQYKHNLAHRERLCCEYDELSPDIRVNQVIKGVLRKLATLPLGHRARKYVKELSLRFDEVANVSPTLEMLDQIVPDRTVARYAAILGQCRWFLNGIYPDVRAGAEDAAALLFDMNKLFEACVTRAARREAWRRGLRLQAQGPRRWFGRDADTGRDVLAMKPDVTFTSASGSVLLVADAKWKLLEVEERKLGVSEADIYQVAAYAARYGAGCAALIYPKQRNFRVGRTITLYTPPVNIRLVPFDIQERSLQEL